MHHKDQFSGPACKSDGYRRREHLDKDVVRHLDVAYLFIGHDLQHQDIFLMHITVADGIAFSDQGLASVFQILSFDGGLICLSQCILPPIIMYGKSSIIYFTTLQMGSQCHFQNCR